MQVCRCCWRRCCCRCSTCNHHLCHDVILCYVHVIYGCSFFCSYLLFPYTLLTLHIHIPFDNRHRLTYRWVPSSFYSCRKASPLQRTLCTVLGWATVDGRTHSFIRDSKIRQVMFVTSWETIVQIPNSKIKS